MPFNLTPAAVEQIKRDLVEWAEADEIFRVSVYTVGNHPELQFHITFGPPEEGDEVLEFSGLKVHVAADSVERLSGTTLDFGPGESGLGFRFIRGGS